MGLTRGKLILGILVVASLLITRTNCLGPEEEEEEDDDDILLDSDEDDVPTTSASTTLLTLSKNVSTILSTTATTAITISSSSSSSIPRRDSTNERCSLKVEHGTCKNYVHKWFFNKTEGKCHTFVYGGCLGNENRFNTEEECMHYCVGGPDRNYRL